MSRLTLLLSASTLTLAPPLQGQQITSEDPAPLAHAAVGIEVSRLTSGDARALEAVGRAVGNARVVMIGEPWHGDGAAIRARAGLVHYLHEQLGFDVLAFEADFYSLNAGWPRVRGADAVAPFARDNVFPFWSASRAAQPLWEYVAMQRSTSTPLEIIGFDIRHTGRLARTELPGELRRRLVATFPHPDSAGVDTVAFFATLDRLLTLEWNYKAPAAEREQFVAVLGRLARAWEPGRAPDDAFWAQEARSLAWAADYAWAGKSRDRAMGENFAWLVAHRLQGRKIVIWAHNNHIIADHRMYLGALDSTVRASVARMSPAQRDSFTYFGDAVRRLFKSDVIAIATLSHEGSYSPLIDVRGYVDSATGAHYVSAFDSVRVLPPTPPGSLEAALAARGFCAAFLDLRAFGKREEPIRTRAIDYTRTPALAMRWWVGYDAFLFLRRTFGLNEAPPECD